MCTLLQGRKKKDKKENGMESENPATEDNAVPRPDNEDWDLRNVTPEDTEENDADEEVEESQFAFKKKGGRLVRVP